MLCVGTVAQASKNAQEHILGILRAYLIYLLFYDFPRQVLILQLANNL